MATERSFERRVTIARPRADVWAFMTAPENSPRWIDGVKETKQVSQDPMGPGAVLRETRTIGKRTETYDIELREFDPPSRYAAAAQAGKAEFVYTFALTDAGAHTQVTMRATARGKGLMARLFIGIGFRFMEKIDGGQLERLKAAAEAAHPR